MGWSFHEKKITPSYSFDKAIYRPFIWGLWTTWIWLLAAHPLRNLPPPNPPNPPGFRDGNLVHRRKDLEFWMGEANMGEGGFLKKLLG